MIDTMPSPAAHGSRISKGWHHLLRIATRSFGTPVAMPFVHDRGGGSVHPGDPALAYRSLLRESSAECVRSGDERALELVLRATVPARADFAYVIEIPSSGAAPHVLVAHVDPVREEQLRDAGAGAGCAAAALALVDRSMRKGEAVLLREVTDAMLRPYIADPAQRSTLHGLALRSAVVVPLTLDAPARGAILLAREASRGSFGPEDLEMLGEIARQASLARDRERLQRDALSIAHTRDAVLAAISHDLRNPLNVIRMGTDALLRHHVSTPEGDLERQQLEVMRHAVGHMSRLVRDLLDTARIDAGRLGVEPAVCQAHDPVGAALEIMGPVAAERSVRILDEIPADLPRVLVDADRIVQVFSNLIGNAIRFTPEGGKVLVRATTEAGEVRYSVVDHGPGIPDELRPHLFNRIWQVQHRARGGMGLGLRIARGIVEAHGGRIWVESVHGQGSTFHFTVPTATKAHGEREAHPAYGAWVADTSGFIIDGEAVEGAAAGIAVGSTGTRAARAGGAPW